jgi:3-hydroxyisobutyrate dehydrogenase-like beta-hydroxyacid dehydrogenase
MNIGLIGLGAMGGAYAKHLLKNNFKCFGIDLDKNNISKFIQLGGQEITYDELFNKVEIVLTSLPSLIAYKDVLNNLKRLGKNNSKKIILDMNTISIDDKNMFKNEINGLNIDMLDSPVSGTGAQAWEADLTVFASGSKELIDKCMNIFKAFSKEVINVGSFGNGMKFKILANLLVTIHNTAAAEALRLGELAGLDKDMIYKVLGNSAATSVMLQKRMPLMINKNYEPPTASFNIFLKDVDIIRNFIKNNNVTLPTFEGSAKIYDKAEKTLSKNWDTASVYEVLKMENIDE